jgi:hypothetical protein
MNTADAMQDICMYRYDTYHLPLILQGNYAANRRIQHVIIAVLYLIERFGNRIHLCIVCNVVCYKLRRYQSS